MKVVSPQQMANMEAQAYKDGSSEWDFMEEAGSGVALVVNEYVERYGFDKQVLLLCGKGNNGGDAYVTGIHLLHLDYSVQAYQLEPLENCSKLCQENAERFLKEGGHIKNINSAEEMALPLDGIIVDGIFGTGFKGEVQEPHASIIEHVNRSGIPIISIDIPSGLNGETGVAETAILAIETAFLSYPKIGFFLRDGWNCVGKLRHVDFGLPEQYARTTQTDMIMLSSEQLVALLPHIKNNRHKYEAGYVVGLAGSPGMSGAAILSGYATLRGGAGITRLLIPEGMQAEMAAAPFELIKTPYLPNCGDELISVINRATAAYIGPGLGRAPKTISMLTSVIPRLQVPCVLDADALTILSAENIPYPEKCILTPHLGEMNRLLGLSSQVPVDMHYLRVCQNFAEEKNVTLVLKGGPTFIFHPEQPIHVNPTGDPGMATAGSGDVLTGLLAALMAQGLTPFNAAKLGVYIHGLAGEHASQDKTPYCMVAHDIITHFPEAFSFEPA